MKISRTSWHFKLFVFMSQWSAAWRCHKDFFEWPHISKFGIGLCPYMRMILIWGPLAILSNILPIMFIVGSFVLFPGFAAGWAGVGWLFGSLVIVIGVVFATFLSVEFVSEWRRNRAPERHWIQTDESDDESDDEPSEGKPHGFIRLFAVWLHDAVCPILEVEK